MLYLIEGCNPGSSHAATTTIRFYSPVGNTAHAGVTAQRFAHDLEQARGRRIELRIDCPGGSSDAARQIFALLQDYISDGGQVVSYVDGIAGSAGSILSQAGVMRYIDRSGSIMIHGPSYPVAFKQELRRVTARMPRAQRQELDDAARQELQDTETWLAKLYASRAGGTLAQWRQLMSRETTFTDEAVRAGLADRVVGGPFAPPMVQLRREQAAMSGRAW